MTSRQARRAAERKANKQARRAATAGTTSEPINHIGPAELIPATEPTEPLTTTPPSISHARLAANRTNAQLSTGPTTPEGKAKSSKNALKTALTGRTVLLPADDADRYERHLSEYRKIFRPVGEREHVLVQAMADTWWRLERIPGIEEALYVEGCNEFAGRVAELDPRARLTMLRMHTYRAYERQFLNLQLQERRLFNYAKKLKEELEQIQNERVERERDALSRAAMLYTAAKKDRQPFHPEEHGFEFSLADIEGFLHGKRARQLTEQAVVNGEINRFAA